VHTPRMMEIIKNGKPWGYELHLGEWQGWRIKILHINKGCKLSKQYHKEKNEYMFNLNDETLKFIPPFKIHRPEAKDEAVEILEISKGSDEDIIRLENDYGRV
jgi:mannose-6-phosphate isomerase